MISGFAGFGDVHALPDRMPFVVMDPGVVGGRADGFPEKFAERDGIECGRLRQFDGLKFFGPLAMPVEFPATFSIDAVLSSASPFR